VRLIGFARRSAASLRAAALVVSLAAAAAACGPPEPWKLRVLTDSYEFRITTEPSPPNAREPILYRVVVLDRETRQLIQGGEGRIFATSPDSANTWDSFTPAPEPGLYTARLNYIHAGDWRVSLQFRRDSTARLEKPADDWVQAVRGARPITERAQGAIPQPKS
jgi:hypothetical protein